MLIRFIQTVYRTELVDDVILTEAIEVNTEIEVGSLEGLPEGAYAIIMPYSNKVAEEREFARLMRIQAICDRIFGKDTRDRFARK